MNWLDKLLRPTRPEPVRTPAPAVRAPVPAPVPRPRADLEQLRATLASATGEARAARLDELGRGLAEAGQAPRAGDPPDLVTAVLCHQPDKAATLAAVAQIDRSDALEMLAIRARYAEVRLGAAERLSDEDALRRVAQGTRERDKNVYRHCQDELRRRRQAIERAGQAAALQAALQRLLTTAPLPISRLIELERQWRELDGDSSCAALVETANQRVRDEAAAQQTLQADRDAAAAVHRQADQADAATVTADELAGWRGVLDRLTATDVTRPPWLAAQPAHAELVALLAQATARATALANARDEAQQAAARTEQRAAEQAAAEVAAIEGCTRFLDDLEQAPVTPEQSQATITAWAALAKPADATARAALDARWQAIRPTAPPAPAVPAVPVAATSGAAPVASERAASHRRPPSVDRDAIRDQLDQLEHALEDGQLHEAEQASRPIRSALDNASAGAELDARWQRAQARLNQLRDWAKWGAERKREDLIAAAQALAIDGVDVDQAAVAVPQLRQEWQRLASQGLPSKTENESFDALLDRAYKPVLARRAERVAAEARIRAAKEALCAEWEAALGTEPAPDLAALDALRQRMIAGWRAAPRGGYKDERALRKRFDALISTVDKRVDALRGAELARREQLITAVEALREAPDLRQAMNDAKALQAQWREEARRPGLRRGDEQALWQRFRAGCDAVFGRRDAERAEFAARHEQRTQARRALLDGFAAELASNDASALERAAGQFKSAWGRGGGDADQALEREARDLQQRASVRLDELRRDALREQLDRWAARAAPIDGLDAEALEEGHAARATLLIDLEIALGLPTPEAETAARRRRQLERLKDRFGSGAAATTTPDAMLVQWYAIPAAPDAGFDARIAAVAARLVVK